MADDKIPKLYDDAGEDINSDARLLQVGSIIAIGIGGLLLFSGGVGAVFGACFIVGGLVAAFIAKQSADENQRNSAIYRMRKEQSDSLQIEEIRDMSKTAVEKISQLQAREAGDIIIAGANATIINRSLLINAMNKPDATGIAESIKTIAGYIEK